MATCTKRALEDLVRAHLPLVGHLVRELLGRVPAHVSRDDLVSAGMAALATAAKGFDAGRGTPFSAFATARIRGALLDELRGLDWASRSVRSRARRIDSATRRSWSSSGSSRSARTAAAVVPVPSSTTMSAPTEGHGWRGSHVRAIKTPIRTLISAIKSAAQRGTTP